jgi:cell division protein FtsB
MDYESGRENPYFSEIEEQQRLRRERRAEALQRRRHKARAEKAEREKPRRGFVAGRKIVLVCMTTFAVISVGVAAFHIMDLKGQEEKALQELAAKTEQKARLESQLAAIQDKSYIEEQARERLGMVKPGETVYIFDDTEQD